MALAKGEEDLMIVADWMIIISASLQLLAMVAGWVVASGISRTCFRPLQQFAPFLKKRI